MQLAEQNLIGKLIFDPAYGARPLGRVIQTEIKDKLSDEILFGQLQSGGLVSLDMTGDQLTFDHS